MYMYMDMYWPVATHHLGRAVRHVLFARARCAGLLLSWAWRFLRGLAFLLDTPPP